MDVRLGAYHAVYVSAADDGETGATAGGPFRI
jgi:hypothetical protein